MTENFLQILFYIFKHYIDDKSILSQDSNFLLERLIAAGLARNDAQQLIETLAGPRNHTLILGLKQTASVRVYTAAELHKLSTEARGYLFFLEQCGVLDGVSRERIIQRAMELQVKTVELAEIRYLIHALLLTDGSKTGDEKQLRDLVMSQGTQH